MRRALCALVALTVLASCSGDPDDRRARRRKRRAEAAERTQAAAGSEAATPRTPPPPVRYAGGRTLPWWSERLTELRREGPPDLYDLAVRRARANGLEVREASGAVEVVEASAAGSAPLAGEPAPAAGAAR
jgi:hypothetical protein